MGIVMKELKATSGEIINNLLLENIKKIKKKIKMRWDLNPRTLEIRI